MFVAVIGAALVGCSAPVQEESAVVDTTVAAPSSTGQEAAVGALHDFATFAQELPGRVGLTIVPVGGGQAITGGDLMSASAWSTIKVPLAQAALAVNPVNVDSATAAITASDNEAAQTMWDTLGSGTVAAAAVRSVLASHGDPATIVQPEVVRPGFSAFGQTEWPLVNQAQFAATLPCDDSATTVLSMMEQIDPSQAWGLGKLPGAQFKGGWGPDEAGGYVVRQFGIVDTANGQVAVAIAAAPDSGSFDDGTVILDRIALWLEPHLAQLSFGTVC